MSKLLALLGVPAVAGLVVWNVVLTSEVGDLREELAERDSAAKTEAPRPADSRPREASPRAMQQVNDLAVRVAEVEKRLPPVPEASATAEGAAPAATDPAAQAAAGEPTSTEIAAAFSSETFKGAVARVLDEREAQRRKERMERQADGRVRYLLRDLNVTEQQRTDVRRLLIASLEKIEKIRDDETLSEEQRRTDVQAAQQEQLESFAAVLDAQTMETVRQRVRPGGRVRGPGGGGGGGGGDTIR